MEPGAGDRGQPQSPRGPALGADGGGLPRPHRTQRLGQDVHAASPGRYVLHRNPTAQATVRTILPWVRPVAISSCALPASSSGKVSAMCGRIRPSSTSLAIASSEA